MIIRPFVAGDEHECYAVFRAAVHGGTSRFYSEEQRWAWCPDDPAGDVDAPAGWRDRLDTAVSLVAQADRKIQGFMTLHADGHVDFAYVRPEQMGTGLATSIYQRLEVEAKAMGMAILTTEASHLAKRFFIRQGWSVDAAQHVIRAGVAIDNFRMSKTL